MTDEADRALSFVKNAMHAAGNVSVDLDAARTLLSHAIGNAKKHGHTPKEIAEICDVSRDRIYQWTRWTGASPFSLLADGGPPVLPTYEGTEQ